MSVKYFVAEGREAKGPFTIEQLRQQGIKPSTLMWHDRMPEWARADEIEEIRREVLGIEPTAPIPPYGQPTAAERPFIPPTPDAATRQAYGTTNYAQQSQPYNNGYQQRYNNGYNDNNIPPCPPNYLGWSIAITLLCCMVLGIIAIVYSTRVNSLYSQGLYYEAEKASRTTKNLVIWGAVLGVVGNGIAAVLSFASGFANALQNL